MNRKQYHRAPEMQLDANNDYYAVLHTDKGRIKAQLFAQDAPKTVNNFVFLAREGYYDGTKFHRVIRNFMIQGGDPTGTGRGGPGYRFEDETIPSHLSYERGTLAMANAGPDTNGSQFFIVHQDYPLPKNYTIFGRVTEGLDVLDAIASVRTAGPERSTPTEDVKIQRVEIEEVARG